ncbi:hypothetical protein GL50803_0090659 [Giardia duodenalis]|uniref:Uncharacterized protein n=1 Tax=Giardia intestinalis (strain ATCC 50803 / WB clone C6) TaxID=184922 RepID=D3KH28_GIAIC|nr:hypothetical protein GL50803_0090659 [Giardia intestinalis]KAE8305815.1 hypothetical protein GL50803_0090659 [Giardia intestinalis]
MQLRLTRGPSHSYTKCTANLLLDPVQNTDDLLLFYRSAPSHAVIFFAPRYHELIRRSHLSLQRIIHDDNSSVALCTFVSQLSTALSAAHLQCMFTYIMTSLLRRMYSNVLSALAFRDDTYVFYHKSHPKSINFTAPSSSRGDSLPLKKRTGDNRLLHTEPWPLTPMLRRPSSYALFRSFDDSCIHMCLTLQPRYAITDLQSFIQYGSKVLPRRTQSWDQIVNVPPTTDGTERVPAIASAIKWRTRNLLRQKTPSVKGHNPFSRLGATLNSPYLLTKCSRDVIQRSESILKTSPPKTSRATSRMDDPVLNKHSKNEPLHSELALLKELDPPLTNSSPVLMQTTEKFVSTLSSTSLFDDQSLVSGGCECGQNELFSKLVCQNYESLPPSQAIGQQDINEFQLSAHRSNDMSNLSNGNSGLILSPTVSSDACLEEQLVLQGSTTTMTSDHSCQLDHSLSSAHQESYTAPLVTPYEQHQFPNDMDIYDLDVVSCSTEMAPVAFATPLKGANNESTETRPATQCLRTFQVQLEADPMKVQQKQPAIKFSMRTSQVVDQSNVDHCPKVTTSPVHIEAPLSGTSMIRKKAYAIVGDRIAHSLNQGAIPAMSRDSLASLYALTNSSSSDKASAGIFDRIRLKLNARRTGITKNLVSPGPTSFSSSYVNSESLTCVSLGGSGHTYLMSMLLLQQSRRSANKKRASYGSSTLLAPSSSRAEMGWRPTTAIANEGKIDDHNNNPKNRVTSQTVPKKRMRCRHLDDPITSRDKGSARCKTILNLEIPLSQK